MTGTFEELLRTGRLPSPSGVGAKILSLTQDEDATVDDIATTLARDPALTGRILGVANSAQTAGTVPISTAKAAAMRLGMKTVSSIAVGFTIVSSNRRGFCKGFDYPVFWSISMATAAAAQELARRVLPEAIAEAFTAGLLMRIGRLGLASAQPEVYGAVLRLWNGGLEHLRKLELEHLRLDHAELATLLLADWGIATEVLDAVRGALFDDDELPPGPTRELAAVLGLASYLASRHVGNPDSDLESDPGLSERLERVHLSLDDLRDALPEITAEWHRLSHDLELRPLPPEDESAARSQPDAPTPEDKPLVLVVDDDPIALRILSNCIGRGGYRVAATTDPEEALALAVQHEPAVLITDWQMPKMDGLSLCRALRRCEVGRRLFVMVLTSLEDEDACVEAFDAEADDFIQRPFHPRQILARIQVGVRLAQAQDDLGRQRVESDHQGPTARIGDLACADRALGEQSGRDPATGLPNRVFATSRLAVLFEQSRAKDDRALSVIALAIDSSAGHAGSTLLSNELSRKVAEVVAPCLRKHDPFCCTGPGEFLLLCPDTDLLEAAAVAERLREAVEVAALAVGDRTGLVTVSAGVAHRSAATPTAAKLLELAELALELGATEGANAVHAAA